MGNVQLGEMQEETIASTNALLVKAGIHTSEQLVKALKVSQSPSSGISKIQLASAAWQNVKLFVPKKPELLSEWVLESLSRSVVNKSNLASEAKGKGKQKPVPAPSSADPTSTDALYPQQPYWQLLDQIIQSQLNSVSLSRSQKFQWINNLATCHPLIPLSASFARMMAATALQEPLQSFHQVLVSASNALVLLLPPATSRTAANSIETVTDAIQAWLQVLTLVNQPQSFTSVGLVLHSLVESWSTALEFGTNSKKNAKFFLSNTLPHFLTALHSTSQIDFKCSLQVKKVLEKIGSQSVFTSDFLASFVHGVGQQSLSHAASLEDTTKVHEELLEKLDHLIGPPQGDDNQTMTASTLSSLAVLLQLLTQRLRQKASLLIASVASTSYSNMSAAASQQAQQSTVRSLLLTRFLIPISKLIQNNRVHSKYRVGLAKASRDLLQQIETLDLYVPGSQDHKLWIDLFTTLFNQTIQSLENNSDPVAAIVEDYQSLEILWKLEQSIVEPQLTRILSFAALEQVSKPHYGANEILGQRTTAALSLLQVVIVSFSKARNVPKLVEHVVEALGLAAENSNIKQVMSGLVLSSTFSSKLGKAVHDFVTPMQLVSLLERLREMAHQDLQSLSDVAASPPAKRRRTATDKSISAQEAQQPAATYRLNAGLQIIALVLHHLEIAQAIRKDAIGAAERIHNDILIPCINLGLQNSATGWSMRMATAALRARYQLLSNHWRFNPDDPIKLDGSAQQEALGCLEAGLDERKQALLKLLQVKDDGPSPEMVIEIVRTLFKRAERDHVYLQQSSDYTELLSQDTSHLVQLFQKTVTQQRTSTHVRQWNGTVLDLDSLDQIGPALWYLASLRWAELIDLIGSPKLLSIFSETLISSLTMDPSLESSVAMISERAVMDASFLELHRWQTALISAVLNKTSLLDSDTAKVFQFKDMEDLDGNQYRTEKSVSFQLDQIKSILLPFAALKRFPVEWIPRSSRDTLLERAWTLDSILIAKYSTYKDETQTGHLIKYWTHLRKFIANLALVRENPIEASSSKTLASLDSLISPILKDEPMEEGFLNVSVAAFKTGIHNLIGSCRNPSTSQLACDNLIWLYQVVDGFPESNAVVRKATQIIVSAFVGNEKLVKNSGLVESWKKVFSLSFLSDSIQQHVDHCLKWTKQKSQGATTKSDLEVLDSFLKQVRYSLELIRVLYHTSTWTQDHDSVNLTLIRNQIQQLLYSITFFISNTTLSLSLMTNDCSETSQRQLESNLVLEVCCETLRVLASCQGCRDGSEQDQSGKKAGELASLTFASFQVCLGQFSLTDELTSVFIRLISKLEPQEYDVALNKLVELLIMMDRVNNTDIASTTTITSLFHSIHRKDTARERASLITTIGILLCNGPEGTSKIARGHLTRLLGLLVQGVVIGSFQDEQDYETDDLKVMFAQVETIERICSTKAMLLRQVDVGMILQRISELIAPSYSSTPCHQLLTDPTAAKLTLQILNAIFQCLDSLIRLRQDLMIHFLPHLAEILSSLCLVFRRPTSNTSGTHQRQLRKEMPFWLDPMVLPVLRAQFEARCFSRLLVSLTVKNVSLKTFLTGKAESLVKPFSKHAVYVLVAYLRSLTVPHTLIPSEIRFELEPGILALCSIIGTHERDAAMVGMLDAAGKILLKRIWKQWELERYKGQ